MGCGHRLALVLMMVLLRHLSLTATRQSFVLLPVIQPGGTSPLLTPYLVLIFSAFVVLHHRLPLGQLQYLHHCWPSFLWFDWKMPIFLGKWFGLVHSTGLCFCPASILGFCNQDVSFSQNWPPLPASDALLYPLSGSPSSSIHQSIFISRRLLSHWLWLLCPTLYVSSTPASASQDWTPPGFQLDPAAAVDSRSHVCSTQVSGSHKS